MHLLVFPQMNPNMTEKLILNGDIYCFCKNLRYRYKCNLIACGFFLQRSLLAFHARQLTDQKNIKDKTVVVFADVTLNTRNAYSATTDTGVFAYRMWSFLLYLYCRINIQIIVHA